MLNELASAVTSGRVHPRELVFEALARIERLDPDLNTVVSLVAELALDAAESSPRTGPLAGIPFLVKDLVRAEGTHTSFGSRWFNGAPLDTVDDAVVARLRAAGAIVVGKSNTPAFGHTALTTNSVIGASRNPWNRAQSPGGSSGGSAAALAGGLVPIATSTDGGGSVRIPASLCGLVGYKPTIGAIGRSGGAPRWITFSSAGCTGRSVADVALEASVVFGPVAGDLQSLPRSAMALGSAPFARPTRVFVAPSFGTFVAPAIASAFASVADVIADAGFAVSPGSFPAALDLLWHWVTISCAELAQSLEDRRELWDSAEPSLRPLLERGTKISLSDYIGAQRARFEATAQLDEMLGDDGVLITLVANGPSYPAEGPMPISVPGATGSAPMFNTPQFNATGHPAASVPLGIDDSGVPFGLQIIGPRWRDDLVLGLAEEWEQLRPWPTVAPDYEPWPMP